RWRLPCSRCRCSASTWAMSRYETGHSRPGWATLQALLALYNASDDERAEAAALWEDAGERAA
ncbi:helix-turn-helix domain-containing protein, partial [Saccharopolyspora spinosa]|uniref:helix-turn-helix domain-containing protein n=1 Tax=Saccharopolyspora spinosa TaxID=60894 RepID=UPI001ED8C457